MDERTDSGLTPREWFRDEHKRAMARLGQLHLLAGQADLAIPLFKQLLETEPTIEEVVRDLLRCYELLGDLELVERAEDDLRAALGVCP
jgi:DNA-binding SARP family transcriptional activator